MQSLQQALPACCNDLQVEREEEAVSIAAVLCFPASFPGFAGHFPSQPVLPGILQLAAIRHLAETALGRPLFPTGYERTKFRGMIAPGEQTRATVQLQQAGQGWSGRFTIKRMHGELVAGGHCTFSTSTAGPD